MHITSAVSHDISTSTGQVEDAWKIPYYFRVDVSLQCDEAFNVSGIQNFDRYQAASRISTDAQVLDSGYLFLTARDSVKLLPGFLTGNQSQFLIEMDSCSSQ